MKGLILLWSVLAAPPTTPAGVETTPNVLAESVAPINRRGEDFASALLLVFVVDQNGDPLEGADVRLLFAKGKQGSGRTVKDGTALMRSDQVGRLRVRASMAGHVPAEARHVLLKRNGITVIALALESEGTE